MPVAPRFLFVFGAAVIALSPVVAEAQTPGGCQNAPRPTAGVALGRSSPYFEPSLISSSAAQGSVSSRGDLLFGGRADVPMAGPWRARIEGAITNWRLQRQIYSADLRQVIGTESAGQIDVGDIVLLAGRQAGRAPVCAYVLAGGGVYWLNYQDARYRRPGFALALGLEFSIGAHGAIQPDAQLHLVNTGSSYPIGSSTVVDGRLAIGWVYRF